ncbi:cytochrome b5-like heme/steroid binding domain-containing protein [Aspergillus ambiguus]|uniref:putative heme/steroid binding domain protein n=1 Tax=Aspergillus ambiguus TaxID=176160 RepID=UPI003CCCE169
MSELRQRQTPSSSGPKPDTDSHSSRPQGRHNERRGISVLDILRVLVTLVVASCGLSYYMTSSESLLWGYRPWFTRWPEVSRYLQGPLLLTPDQLALYDGSDPARPIYLAVNGSIFDVSANPLVYGPGGHYSFFTGKDATRAFVTGCFEEDLTPDLRGVEEMFMPIDDSEELQTLSSGEKKIRREQDRRLAMARVRQQVQHWQNFFRNHKKYFEVGKVVGMEVEKGEKRELCQAAKQQRPKRKDMRHP